MTTPIRKILIANRGEIACRIIRTAHQQGFLTVAVYSDADKDALHVSLADEAVYIGSSEPAASYLNIEQLLNAASITKADAIHPGYGFLSENADFARACEAAGLMFIGPSAHAIALMGSKRLSKVAMIAADVPCIPGYEGEDQSDATLIAKANEIGFPLMVKASAGGGGKGMRLIKEEHSDDLAAQISMARSEAQSAFGSSELILERALIAPRHIEIQVFADQQGNTVYLGERDCSIQRRHQKVIEEAPSPFVDDTLRQKMGEAAVNAAKACNYCGAGTVEFLVDSDKQFYFLEMNTRLQVEHPVTEMITGIDLVEWQLRIACGEALPLRQEAITINGHAIEARLYAEDPRNQFMPQTGTIAFWQEAKSARTDHGLKQNTIVSAHYDPMLAKVIVWADNRANAARKLSRALHDTKLVGVNTNKHFLHNIVKSTAFLSDDVTTAFIDTYANNSDIQGKATPSFSLLAKAALLFGVHSHDKKNSNAQTPYWQSAAPLSYPIKMRCNEDTIDVAITQHEGAFVVKDKASSVQTTLRIISCNDHCVTLEENNLRHAITFGLTNNDLFIDDGTGHFHITQVTHHKTLGSAQQQSAEIRAVMDGVIVALLAQEGTSVKAGDTVAIMEAMKMEHPLKAAADGIVTFNVQKAGEQVKSKQVIATVVNKEENSAEQISPKGTASEETTP